MDQLLRTENDDQELSCGLDGSQEFRTAFGVLDHIFRQISFLQH